MPPQRSLSFSLGLASILLLAVASTAPAGAIDFVGTFRAEGPAGLDKMLAERAKVKGPAPDLDRLIDAIAAQRYATVSHLYWYTDLATAQAAARAQGKPILALRMLGRLDEDLSCANSRMFRATLYANRDVAAFLRSSVILYWSSERPVPRVTIDYGDGRRIETTVTGNSAHYVLDADGTVLDVLPGLYAPHAFLLELTKSLGLARKVRGLAPAKRRSEIVAYHQARLDGRKHEMELVSDVIATSPTVIASHAALAQRQTMSKAYIEVPALAKFAAGVDPGAISPRDVEMWTALGKRLWPSAHVLDAQSRTLVTQIHGEGAAQVIPRLEDHIFADTAIDEIQVRPLIDARFVAHDEAFGPLNDWIYATVFHTPRTDAWIGLLPRTEFTGLPADGVVMP